jgi:hypothetical protein
MQQLPAEEWLVPQLVAVPAGVAVNSHANAPFVVRTPAAASQVFVCVAWMKPSS